MRFGREQSRAAGGDHNRIDYDIPRFILAQPSGDRGNYPAMGYHADLHAVGKDIGEYAVELLFDKFGRSIDDAVYSGGILRGQGGYDAHRVHTVRGDGFDIRLYAGSAAAVRAGDGEYFFHNHIIAFVKEPLINSRLREQNTAG